MKRSPMPPRSAPMKQSGFARPDRIEAREVSKLLMPPRKSTLKSRQLARTPADIELHDRLAALGCIACMKDGKRNTYVSIHHIDGRTKPGCHQLVLPLCGPHHQRDDNDPQRRIAIHPDKARFEARYGKQRELLAECHDLLKEY